MSRSIAIAAAAMWFQTPKEKLDDLLQRVAKDSPADVHPALWNDLKRYVFTVCEAFYRPRG